MRKAKLAVIFGAGLRAALDLEFRSIGLVCLAALMPIVLFAQDQSADAIKFKVLVNFDGTNGSQHYGIYLTQGTDGNLYGATNFGGANNSGTVFRVTPSGKLTTIYSFCSQPNCTDGGFPFYATLVLGTDGNFYGVVPIGGGGNGLGGVFRITPSGSLTTLHNFCLEPNCADGDIDYGGLVLGIDGNFYGTTSGGGINNPACSDGLFPGCGTVFKITPEGAFTTIYAFCSLPNCMDGENPFGGLMAGADGSLYGTTFGGGANGAGTLFRLSLGGTLTTLHSFDSSEGSCGDVCGPLIQARNGNLYGTRGLGGANGGGTVFEITPAGAFTTLYSFCSQPNCADGSYPWGLYQASDGNFYGATATFSSPSTIFRITPQSALTILHTFNGSDGSTPFGVSQATNGVLYGQPAGAELAAMARSSPSPQAFPPFWNYCQPPARLGVWSEFSELT